MRRRRDRRRNRRREEASPAPPPAGPNPTRRAASRRTRARRRPIPAAEWSRRPRAARPSERRERLPSLMRRALLPEESLEEVLHSPEDREPPTVNERLVRVVGVHDQLVVHIPRA